MVRFPCFFIYIHKFSTYSLIDKHLGYFHILIIVDNTAKSIGVQISLQVKVFVSIGYIPRSVTVESYDSTILDYLKNLHITLHSSSIYNFTNNAQGFFFSSYLSHPLLIIDYFGEDYSKKCEVIFHCVFKISLLKYVYS